MVGWELRPAVAGDVEAVAELRAVVLRADLERLGRYDERRVRQRPRDAYVPAYSWIVEVDARFVGCISLRPAADAHWLEHFYLDAELQVQGVGTAVLRRTLQRCDSTRVRLNVLRGSQARRRYERHRFTVESEEPVDVFMVREPVGADRAWPGRPRRSSRRNPWGGSRTIPGLIAGPRQDHDRG